MTEDKDKWRKYVYGVANPRFEEGYRTEQCILYIKRETVKLTTADLFV